MRITELLAGKPVTLSFEVFPPKTDDGYESVSQAVTFMSAMHPDYISVTYGAGGGTSKNTVRIATDIQRTLGTTALPHLTCVSSSRQDVALLLDQMQENGLHNVLALRGDRPQDLSDGSVPVYDYQYAFQLIEDIRARGNFCIGAACYPEGHVESTNRETDLQYLKEKVDRGVDFLVTQMFFDNRVLYDFQNKALQKNITVPIVVGVMPVTSAKLIRKICQMSGTSITPELQVLLDTWGEDPEGMKQAGIQFASEQIADLVRHGVRGIHVYTMNKPDVAQMIKDNMTGLLT
jgi:methylenetetrahydrofolate reductase (NADPH)